MKKKNSLMLLVLPFILLASCTAGTGTLGTSESTSIISDITEPPETEYETIEIGRVTGDKPINSIIILSFADKTQQTLGEEIIITAEIGTALGLLSKADYAVIEIAEVYDGYKIYENGFYRSFRINNYSKYGAPRNIWDGEKYMWSGQTVIGLKFTGNDLTQTEGKLGFILRVYDTDGKEITEDYRGVSVCYVKNSTHIIICTDDKFEQAKRTMGS